MPLMPEIFSRLNLYDVLHSLPDGVTLADAEGRIIFSNAAADRILGTTAATDASSDEWSAHYGVFLLDGSTPFPTSEYPLLRALCGEHPHDVEMLVRNEARPDGAIISVSGRPLFADESIIGAAVVFRDVTRLRRVQAELERTVEELTTAQKAKDELAAFLIHDLKSPLTAITGLCDLITVDNLHDKEQVIDDVQTIKESAWRLNGMVVDLLDIQMAEDGALDIDASELVLAEMLEHVAESAGRFARARGHRIEVDCEPDVSLVADPDLLYRLVMNLVDNCFKYGPEGGGIWLTGKTKEGGPVVITVRDEGPGVPAELRERIFEKYSLIERDQGRVKDSRGLGLRFCGVVAEAHGGRIWVEDAEPRGARFCVELSRGTTGGD